MHNPFKKPAHDEPKAPADKAREHLDALRAAEPALVRTYDEAAFAAIDGTGSHGAADTAWAALAVHRQTIARAEDSLQAVDRREQSRQAEAAGRARDDAWTRVEGHARRRVAIAQRVAADAKRLGESAAALAATTTEMHRALPGGYPIHRTYSFGVGPSFVADVLRMEYARNGLPGSGIALEGKTPKPLEQHCAETLECITAARKEAA